MTLTKDMEKDFKFMSLYSYTKRYKKMPFDNRIFWNNKIMFATNGNSFIWTETIEENPEDFSVWEVQGKNFVEVKGKDKEVLKSLNLDNKVFNRYNNFDFEFEFNWNKSIPLPIKLCSKKQQRDKDICFFDFVHNNFIVKFSKGNEDEVIANYGDFFSGMSGDITEGFRLPFWEILELVKHTKDSVKVKIGSVKSEILGFSQFCKMSSGKWNIIATSLN